MDTIGVIDNPGSFIRAGKSVVLEGLRQTPKPRHRGSMVKEGLLLVKDREEKLGSRLNIQGFPFKG